MFVPLQVNSLMSKRGYIPKLLSIHMETFKKIGVLYKIKVNTFEFIKKVEMITV